MSADKQFLGSLTIWGAAVTGIAALVQWLGLGDITAEEQVALAQHLTHAGEAMGLVMVIVGRWRATGPLRFGRGSRP